MARPEFTLKVFEPAPPGGGWPYSLIMGLGAAGLIYAAYDLHLLAQGSDDPSATTFVVGLIFGAFLFLVSAYAFWYFPWSKARISLAQDRVHVSSKSVFATNEADIGLRDLRAVQISAWHRATNILTFDYEVSGAGESISLKTAALADEELDIVKALEAWLLARGRTLDGPELKLPAMGVRRWNVRLADNGEGPIGPSVSEHTRR